MATNTKRVPINRPARGRLSPAALDAFRRMRRLKCSCSSETAWIYGRQCDGCKTWKHLHWTLHRELKLRPWDFYGVVDIHGHGNEAERARTRELEAALAALRREGRR
jgi:hypothetical protein